MNIMRCFGLIGLLALTGCGEPKIKPGDKITIMADSKYFAAPYWPLFATPEIDAKVKHARATNDQSTLNRLYDEQGTIDVEGAHPAIFRSETETHVQIETTLGTTSPKVWMGYVNKSDVIVTRAK